jgi:hypothetical protein
VMNATCCATVCALIAAVCMFARRLDLVGVTIGLCPLWLASRLGKVAIGLACTVVSATVVAIRVMVAGCGAGDGKASDGGAEPRVVGCKLAGL